MLRQAQQPECYSLLDDSGKPRFAKPYRIFQKEKMQISPEKMVSINIGFKFSKPFFWEIF
jgi:hypothetical protein